VDLHEVDVFIDADGEVRIEVRGMKGGACLDVTAPLEAALGADVVSRELTPEAAATLAADVERHEVRET
jgi:FixJ family two-component response regulator